MTGTAAPTREWPGTARNADTLSDHLASWARRSPRALALGDQPGRRDWSGRPPLTWTAYAADTIAARLAAAFGRLRLPPGSPVAIWMPGGSETCLAMIAVERAGLRSCLIPPATDEAALARTLEAAKARAIVTQARVADLRPAETAMRVARDYFGLRCVAAFGPAVPEGVMDLDRAMLEAGAGSDRPAEGAGRPAGPGLLAFDLCDGELPPAEVSAERLLQTAGALARLRPAAPGDRILSLLPGLDLASLVPGLAAALLGRCTFQPHGLFRSADLEAALSDSAPTHLVAPAWMEDGLADAGIAAAASITLIHRPPARFRRSGQLGAPVVDLVALGPAALIGAARDTQGRSALTIPHVEREPSHGSSPLSAVRRDGLGRLLTPANPDGWRPSGYRVETVGDHLAAVSRE